MAGLKKEVNLKLALINAKPSIAALCIKNFHKIAPKWVL
jgi:hypothetical protein